jgi:hypothetical protein
MTIETPKFRQRQAAELAAQAVEREIRRRLLEAPRDALRPDLQKQLAVAGTFRRNAHGLFQEAMIELDLASEAVQHRVLMACAFDVRRSDLHGRHG